MKKVLKFLGSLLLILVLCVAGFYGWASFRTKSLLARHVTLHDVDFPIPFPSAEAAGPDEGTAMTAMMAVEAAPAADPRAVALQEAIDRGRHLVNSRYGCTECHGKNFGGGTMIDAAPIGHLFGPNITTGQGSRTLAYTAKDWDHIVRHGVKPDGTPSAMPAQDFQRMSDQELSDIVAYVRSMPPVDAAIPAPVLGPLGKVLVATGKIPLAADLIDHSRPHPAVPPQTAVTVEFGEHLAATCMGCHRADLTGGAVPGGDPSWPPAANLTPRADGLAKWSFEDFQKAVTTGVRPDGTALKVPMSEVTGITREMSEVELRALWAFLQSVPAKETGA